MGLLNRILGRDIGRDRVAGMRVPEQEHESMAGASMARDPVCGMEVNKEKAPAVFLYLGQTLYFCSPSCQRLFRGNTGKYMKHEGHEMAGHSSHHRRT